MGRACSTREMNEKHVQYFCRKTWKEETTCKT